jgi:hypothetical protein
MRQVIVDRSGNPKIVVLSDEANACGIAGGSNNAQLAWRPTPQSSAWVRAALPCIIATLLASTSASVALENAPGGGRSVQLAQAMRSEPKGPPQALEQEHQRAEMLARELAVIRHDLESLQTRLKQVAEQGAAEQRTSLQQERERIARLEQELALARSTMPVAGQTAQARRVETDAAKPVAAETVAVANARGGSPGNPEDTQDMTRLVARASVLLGQGDIGSARIVLERAAESGNAQASFMLAETYDPLILSQWGTYGTRGDATKARSLYAKAEAGGIKEAKQRFDAFLR